MVEEAGHVARPWSAGRVILTGAAIVAVFDGIDAIVFFGLRGGTSPLRIGQAIAAGFLGQASFTLGWRSALLGLLVHCTVAGGVVATYYLVSRVVPTLAQHPVACGIPYGIVVYLVMNLVVIPFSAIPPRPFHPAMPVLIDELLIHMFGVGLPTALVVSRASRVRS